MAEATIKIRVRVNDANGNLVMYAGPGGENGIVFARRSQELMAKFGGILTDDSITCDADGCGIDYTTVTDEQLQLVLRFIPFLFSKNDIDDTNVTAYKTALKLSLLAIAFMFLICSFMQLIF